MKADKDLSDEEIELQELDQLIKSFVPQLEKARRTRISAIFNIMNLDKLISSATMKHTALIKTGVKLHERRTAIPGEGQGGVPQEDLPPQG